MNKMGIGIFLLFFGFSFSQTYCTGDQISLEHQNSQLTVGAGFEEYNAGDDLYLSDFNGDLNGGSYSIIFVEMSASWWGTCISLAPSVDELEQQFSDYNVKFITGYQDAGTSNSGTSNLSSLGWQNLGIDGIPLVIDQNASSISLFDLLHDSYSAFPTFALIDHTMTLRGKPWTLTSNSNTNSCDGNSSYLDGWSGGNVENFIQQLLDECGVLCEDNPDVDLDGVLSGDDNCPNDYNPDQYDADNDNIGDVCDDCNDMAGDINDDLLIDVLDIVSLVNIILVVNQNPSECEISDADYNNDSIVNIQDVILVINNILN